MMFKGGHSSQIPILLSGFYLPNMFSTCYLKKISSWHDTWFHFGSIWKLARRSRIGSSWSSMARRPGGGNRWSCGILIKKPTIFWIYLVDVLFSSWTHTPILESIKSDVCFLFCKIPLSGSRFKPSVVFRESWDFVPTLRCCIYSASGGRCLYGLTFWMNLSDIRSGSSRDPGRPKKTLLDRANGGEKFPWPGRVWPRAVFTWNTYPDHKHDGWGGLSFQVWRLLVSC